MIKYPADEIKRVVKREDTLKDIVNAGIIKLGQRFFVGENPVTCVHIDGNKYIFSMDDIFKATSHNKISFVLKEIYSSGKIDGINVIPMDVIKDIDFLFVPGEYRVFGENKYSDDKKDVNQFDWFKRGDSTRVKGYHGIEYDYWRKGEPCAWWLCSVYSGDPTRCCSVSDSGYAGYHFALPTIMGVPIFFQMTKES